MNPKENTTSISEKNERQSASWDLRNAFRNYSTLVFSQILSAFFSFASVWLATRFLGTEGYGGIVAVIAASQVVQIFVNWTSISLARYGVEEFVETGKIGKSFWARSFILLPNTLVLLALSFLWLPVISGWLKLPPETVWYVIAHFLVQAVWIHVQHALQGAKLPRLQGILLAVERVLIFSGLLILALSGKIDYLSAVAVYVASPFLMSLVGLFSLRKLISKKIEFDAEWIKKMLRFSVPLIPFSVVGYLAGNYLDAIFIAQYLSKVDLGIYSVAYQIMGIFMQFPVLAGSLLMPLFVTLRTNNQSETVSNYLRNVLPVVTLAWGLVCVFFAIGGNFFLPIIFGESFNESGKLLLILTISAAVNAPILLGYSPFTNAASATYIGAAINIALAFANLIGNVILIPKYGLVGSVWATNLAYSTSLLVAFVFVRYKFSLRGDWTVPTILPTILSLSYAAWSGNLLIALLTALAATAFLLLLHRDSIRQSVKFLSNFRKYQAANIE